MARQLSDAKRQALLQAAIATIASSGISASTAVIAKQAGVAEGTLFKYFPNKSSLLNAVYAALKTDMRVTLLKDFPTNGSAKARSQHIWKRYVNWGAANPSHRRAISQLAVSKVVTDETRREASQGFDALRDLMQSWSGLCHATWNGDTRNAFASAMLTAIADTTIDFIARQPRQADKFAEIGFKAFWRAASSKQ